MEDSRAASRNEASGNSRLISEAQAGDVLRPQFAAAGIFTQIEPIVRTPGKRHTDTNSSDMCVSSALCNCSQVFVCVCLCVTTNLERMRKTGKLFISTEAARDIEDFTLEPERGFDLINSMFH